MSDAELLRKVEAVRRFSRFYTRQIGALREGLHDSPFPLTESRVIYELAHHEQTTASELASELGLDPGYLSRILRSFEGRGLIQKQASETDARQQLISLTPAGQDAFALLNARSRAEISAMLTALNAGEQERLVGALQTVEQVLGSNPPRRVPYILRPHQPGDIGWVIQSHGALYAQEYGWDDTFEALVAHVAGDFLQNFDAKRERCWIAEMNGENVGSVFLVKKDDETCKLRLLIVDPKARGLGIGDRLVAECIRFARKVGYRRMTLWTNSILLAARGIYVKAGFRMTASEPHRSFGKDLIGETWELDL